MFDMAGKRVECVCVNKEKIEPKFKFQSETLESLNSIIYMGNYKEFLISSSFCFCFEEESGGSIYV